MSLFFILQMSFTVSYTGVRSMSDFIRLGTIGLILILIFGIWQYSKLKFKVVEISMSEYDLNQILKECSRQLEWNIVSNQNNVIIFTRSNFSLWGERITIVKFENKILINSICDPSAMLAITSLGRNSENVRVFREVAGNFVHNNG